jgi:SAM-dependent methyltransferase
VNTELVHLYWQIGGLWNKRFAMSKLPPDVSGGRTFGVACITPWLFAIGFACATARPLPTPTLTDQEVKARSHAFCDALDRADVAAFNAATGPAYLQFYSTRIFDKAFVLKDLQDRAARGAAPRTRTWKNERVALGPGVGVFIGEATVTYPPEPNSPAGSLTRWYTLVWVQDQQDFKVEHLQLQRGGPEAERDAWNEAFRAGVGFRHEPNRFLVEMVKGLKSGVALDLATGQGRNALYLAQQGWKVTGVDISDEGLRQAAKAASDQHLRLETIEADLDHWDLGTNRWDLVTMIYAGGDPAMVERVKRSVRPGGWVVFEFFHRDATKGTGIGGFEERMPGALFKEGWTVLKDEVVEDTADWSLRKSKLVRFFAQKK